jgi:DNA-binding MarR family transcriptional regulator
MIKSRRMKHHQNRIPISASFFENEVVGVWVNENEPEAEVNRKFNVINNHNFVYYDFVLSYYNYFTTRRIYGSKFKFTMIEAHVLTDIVDNPGITISELADNWRRTSSALSQTVKKLIKGGFVEKRMNQDNYKMFFLFPTDIAKEFALIHKHYDNVDSVKLYKRLLSKFSIAELVTFFKVMEAYNDLLHNDEV